MPFFRCEFRVESDFTIPEDEKQQVVLEAAGATTTLKNGPVDGDGAVSCLFAYVIGDVESQEIATNELRARLASQLDLLSFVTQSRFKISNAIRLIEWEPYQSPRNMHVLQSQDARYPPEPQPLQLFISSAAKIDGTNLHPFVRKAMKYFRLGLLEEQLEDQFMRFWFALEIVAENSKDDEKSPVTCQKCGVPLKCECGHEQSRRPMATDAIRNLMSHINSGKYHDISGKLLLARNTLMHGGGIATLEKKCKLSMKELTEQLGQVSWSAIENALTLGDANEIIIFDRQGDFTPVQMVFSAHLRFTPQGNAPHPPEDAIPNPSVAISTRFKST